MGGIRTRVALKTNTIVIIATMVVMALLLLAPIARAQDDGRNKRGWDVDMSEPPPPGNPPNPSKKPLSNIRPFAFLFYQPCEPMGDRLGNSGRWSFDILSAYTSVGYEHSESDSLVVIKLQPRSRVTQDARICFPAKPFTLRVILVRDTAVFQMDLTAGTFVYIDTSRLLRVESPKAIPDGIVTMQLTDSDKERARDFAKQVIEKYGSGVEQFVLSEGYYPCLPTPGIQRTNIGRKQLLNETEQGYLVCFQIVDQSQMAAVSTWFGEQQLDELKRAASEQIGMKGR